VGYTPPQFPEAMRGRQLVKTSLELLGSQAWEMRAGMAWVTAMPQKAPPQREAWKRLWSLLSAQLNHRAASYILRLPVPARSFPEWSLLQADGRLVSHASVQNRSVLEQKTWAPTLT